MIPYDKRAGKIWYNGELVDWSDVKVHVLSHGLHYASCVFEGERVYDGSIFKLEEHTDRFFYSAVPDFIDLNYNGYHWFVFNVADIFISIGIFLLIFVELFKKDTNDQKS